VVSAFRECDLKYRRAEKNRSELYLEGLPLFSRGLVSLPEHGRLARELRLLERHTSRVGRDVIDHGRNGSDDYSNAVFGALHLTMSAGGYRSDLDWVGSDGADAHAPYSNYAEARQRAYRALAYQATLAGLWRH
jgi:hypothetical protein